MKSFGENIDNLIRALVNLVSSNMTIHFNMLDAFVKEGIDGYING